MADMARIVRPGEPDRTSICVETRQGTPIDNQQEWGDLPAWYQKEARDLEKKFPPPGAEHGSVASSVYNCHGLTFASKRTRIFDPNDIERMIDEDDYGKVDPSNVRPGDIAIYYSGGDAEHSGIVIEVPADLPKRILSKWGIGKEVSHWVSRCPYDSSTVKYFRVKR